MGYTLKSVRTKRTWRRVGWGALIGLGVLVIVVAIALWVGPPRDPKCFALDDEDFGLGFKVGDPWDPDAFEAAMKANGFPLGERSGPEDWAEELELLEMSVDDELTDYPFFSVAWITTDGCLMIHLMSNKRLPTAEVCNIILNSDLPCKEWGRERTRKIYSEADEKYPNSQQERLDFVSEMGAIETAKRYPQISTSEGIGFASSLNEVKNTYGKPFMELPFAPESPILGYFGDHRSVVFFFSNERVTSMTIFPGYRNGGLAWRLGIWYTCAISSIYIRWMERETARYEAE